jgi:hypothetical protein
MYPEPYNETITRQLIQVERHTILLTKYECEHGINLYFGDFTNWYIHCAFDKEDETLASCGNLFIQQYEIMGWADDNTSAIDTRGFIRLLLQYIHDQYPIVTTLKFNDLSTRDGVNLAVMSYLCTGKTWYEKEFGAYISDIAKSNICYENDKKRLQAAKSLPWEEIRILIHNGKWFGYTDEELKQRYEGAQTWQDFFGPILDEMGITEFCSFISHWLYIFNIRYFNNLMSHIFIMPVADCGLQYQISDYKSSERRSEKT